MRIPIDLTNPSPAFTATCKTLLQMADTDGLGDGYAVFGPELGGEGRWYVDLPTAQMSSDGDEVFVRVPNPPGDREWMARANLIAGLVFNIEEARSFQELVPQAAEKYAERERAMLAHLQPVADAPSSIEFNRQMRNVLSRLVEGQMAAAGECIEDIDPEVARANAQVVASLLPIRDALGWQEKVGKRSPQQGWSVPADVIAKVLPDLLAEVRSHQAGGIEATERNKGRADLAGEAIALDTVREAARDLGYLLELQGQLREAGIEIEGGRS